MTSISSLVGQTNIRQATYYALPEIGAKFLYMPIVVVQGIYASDFGLSLATIAMVMLVARLFDAVSDPLIGYVSDRYMEKTGTRKPFIFAGAALLVISSAFLYIPPEGVTVSYFTLSFLAFYLGWTLFDIPHLAWGSELTLNPNERTTIYGARQAVGYLGVVLFFSIPFLPIFETTEITPETLKWSVLLIGLVMCPLLYMCFKAVPDGHYVQTKAKESFRVVLFSILGNKPLTLFSVAYLFLGAGTGMWFAILFIFVDSYLGLGDKFALVLLIAFTVSMFVTPVWCRLANKFGKKQIWVTGSVLFSLSIGGAGLFEPGLAGFIHLLFSVVLGYVGFSATAIMAPSILADISDYGCWRFGKDRAGMYFSVYTLVLKVTFGIGGALGLAISAAYGFEPASETYSAESIFGLRLAAAFLPALISLGSIYFMVVMPINARRHSIIRCRLEVREIRAARVLNKASVVTDNSTNNPNNLQSI